MLLRPCRITSLPAQGNPGHHGRPSALPRLVVHQDWGTTVSRPSGGEASFRRAAGYGTPRLDPRALFTAALNGVLAHFILGAALSRGGAFPVSANTAPAAAINADFIVGTTPSPARIKPATAHASADLSGGDHAHDESAKQGLGAIASCGKSTDSGVEVVLVHGVSPLSCLTETPAQIQGKTKDRICPERPSTRRVILKTSCDHCTTRGWDDDRRGL